MKQVNDAIDEIEQRPTTSLHPLYVMRFDPAAGERLEYSLGQRAHVGIRGSGCDDEQIGGVRDQPQIQHNNVMGLVIFEGPHDQLDLALRFRVEVPLGQSEGGSSIW